jgi:hypothetical protein
MGTRTSVRAMVGGLGLMLSSALAGDAVTPRPVGAPPPRNGPDPWTAHLALMDARLSEGDVAGALVAWHAGYGAALRSRRWEGFADVGDAYLRIGRVSGAPTHAIPRARDLYMSALFRARDAGSLDGVLRIATAFDTLGDREVTMQALRIARRLAGPNPPESVRDRLTALDQERRAPGGL